MNVHDRDRVIFHSVNDLSISHYLSKAESILKRKIIEKDYDINDVLELYNIKLFFDNGAYLARWSDSDINTYKKTVQVFGAIVGKFIAKIDNSNFQQHHSNLIYSYVNSFWNLINNHKQFKKITPCKISESLERNPYQIRNLLKHKTLVNHYQEVICEFLKGYEESAEIILSIYEFENGTNHTDMYLPRCLTIKNKETIIATYINSKNCNINYLPIIENLKKHDSFYISDKIRLEAKRKRQQKNSKFFEENSNSSFKYGVSICYEEKASAIKICRLEGWVLYYEYSYDYIKTNNNPYALYLNFKLLFEYIDMQNRITLTSKTNQLGVLERSMGVRSKNEYVFGMAFMQFEMASRVQIFTYSNILKGLGHSLELILKFVFNTVLSDLYEFSSNADFTAPTPNTTALEKVRTIAPEFESILKQYKLFVENGEIDFELLQMSSVPTAIKDVPSLVCNKYVYINSDNQFLSGVMYLLFSDQAFLTYINPFKDEKYINFADLLINEEIIEFNQYEDYQVEGLNYLIKYEYIFIDEKHHIKVTNWNRILILKDLFESEVASYHRYPIDGQKEVLKMSEEGLLYFGSSLFSVPEQKYFNYYLNKSEFTNGLDLRNSYLHGTQANPSEKQLHEESYLLYLKLLTLVILKIEDDLSIFKKIKLSSEISIS